MMSFGDKLTALACHPTKKVNKTEELTHLFTSIDLNQIALKGDVFINILRGFPAKIQNRISTEQSVFVAGENWP